MDIRLAVLLVWGGFTVAVWGRVLFNRHRDWTQYHDTRARRSLMAGWALFLTAAASASSIFAAAIAPPGLNIRSLIVYLALGAFTAAGLYSADEDRTRDTHGPRLDDRQ